MWRVARRWTAGRPNDRLSVKCSPGRLFIALQHVRIFRSVCTSKSHNFLCKTIIGVTIVRAASQVHRDRVIRATLLPAVTWQQRGGGGLFRETRALSAARGGSGNTNIVIIWPEGSYTTVCVTTHLCGVRRQWHYFNSTRRRQSLGGGSSEKEAFNGKSLQFTASVIAIFVWKCCNTKRTR